MWPLPNERFRLATESEWLPDHRNPFICPLRNERFPVATELFCPLKHDGFLSPAGSQEPFHLRALSFGNPFMWPLPNERFRLATENEWHRNPFICPLRNERFPATIPFVPSQHERFPVPFWVTGTLSSGNPFMWPLPNERFRLATENEWHRNPFICPLRNERFPVATELFCPLKHDGFLSPAGSQEPFHLRALSFGNPFMWPLPNERFRLATENKHLVRAVESQEPFHLATAK